MRLKERKRIARENQRHRRWEKWADRVLRLQPWNQRNYPGEPKDSRDYCLQMAFENAC